MPRNSFYVSAASCPWCVNESGGEWPASNPTSMLCDSHYRMLQARRRRRREWEDRLRAMRNDLGNGIGTQPVA